MASRCGECGSCATARQSLPTGVRDFPPHDGSRQLSFAATFPLPIRRNSCHNYFCIGQIAVCYVWVWLPSAACTGRLFLSAAIGQLAVQLLRAMTLVCWGGGMAIFFFLSFVRSLQEPHGLARMDDESGCVGRSRTLAFGTTPTN